jgi:hypothetical protein
LGLGSSSALLLDIIQRGTNDSSGNLDNSSSLLADDTLILALLVKATPGLGPHQLGRLLAIVKKALALGVGKRNRLAISSDESLAMARVDSEFAESAKFGSMRKDKDDKFKKNEINSKKERNVRSSWKIMKGRRTERVRRTERQSKHNIIEEICLVENVVYNCHISFINQTSISTPVQQDVATRKEYTYLTTIFY